MPFNALSAYVNLFELGLLLLTYPKYVNFPVFTDFKQVI